MSASLKNNLQSLLQMALANQIVKGAIRCAYRFHDGHICNGEPVKYFKHLKTGVYVGFCEDHKEKYPEGWSAFKPVSKDEVVTHEVMDS